MSQHINVHPDHYKEAGRERQGEDIPREEHTPQHADGKKEAPGKAGPRSAPPDKVR